MARKLEVVIAGDTSRLEQAFKDSAGEARGFAKKISAHWKEAAVGIGVAFAAAGAGLFRAMNVEAATGKITAQLGLTAAESKRIGGVAGHLYAQAYGESIEDVNTAVAAVMNSFEEMKDASGGEVEGLTAKVMNLATTFEVDVSRGAQVAGQMVSSGLAKNAGQAIDLLTVSLQKVPTALREDLLDAVDEYGPFLESIGIKGEEAMGLLVAAAEKGMYGIDKTGDALKEFSIRATDMSALTKTAYDTLGISQHEMTNQILAGGDSARDAFRQIVKGLREIKDPAAQSQAALALFGTPLEDLNVQEIPKFLESLDGVKGGLGEVEGAADRMGKDLNNNAKTNLTAFARQFETKIVNYLGSEVIPWLTNTASPAFQTFVDKLGEIWKHKDITISAKIDLARAELETLLVDLGVGADRAHKITTTMELVGYASTGVAYSLLAVVDGLKMVAYAGGAATAGLILQAMYVANAWVATADKIFGAFQALAELPGVPDSWRDKINGAADSVNRMHKSTATSLDLQKETWKSLWGTSGEAAKGMAEHSTQAAQAFQKAFGPNNSIPAPLATIKDQNKTDLDRMMQDMMAGGQNMLGTSGLSGGINIAAPAAVGEMGKLPGAMALNLGGQAPTLFGAGTGLTSNVESGAQSDESVGTKIANWIGVKIVGAWQAIWPAFRTLGGDVLWRIIDGITGFPLDLIAGAAGWIKDRIVEAVTAVFDIHSPSRVMFGLGLNITKGLISGMVQMDPLKFVEKTLGGLGALAAKVPGLFGGLFGGSGVERWRSLVEYALSALGLPASWADITLAQIGSESGGNPNALNLWDSNAQRGDPSGGLLQNIGSAFQSRLPDWYKGASLFDPLGSILAGLRHMVDTYGSPFGVWGEGHGYADGGISTRADIAEVSKNGPEIHLTRKNIRDFGLGGGVTFGPGSIIVNGATSPEATADAVYRKIMQRLERNVRLA